MGTPPRSPLPYSDCQSKATSMRSRQSARLRRTLDQPKVIVNIDPTTGRGLSPHKEKFYNYLGVIPIVHSNWKDVPESLKYLVWDEILHQKPRRRSCQQWRPDGGNLSPPSPLNLCMDSLQEQTTQGTFVPNGHDDILTTAIGRLKDGGRVRAAGSRVTISQYYGRASRGSSSSSTFVDQQ
ncbi:hypothetical protein GmHk_05G012724 [Glycine max]|nr:hypothetical protein GmHk_05G012724 [Glycine max]KAH1249362.1 hypothetical protein GmHk_05G012724 [Glycine max]KAH1249364.1 hypothetical protein GmHk_05G012724 [Glycine max]